MALDLRSIDFPIFPSPDADPFWSAAQSGQFVLPHCRECGPFWYPRSICPTCGSRSIEWVPASREGVVHSFCIHHGTPVTPLRPLVPFVTAFVELNDGPRMVGLLDAEPDPDQVHCGTHVTVELRETATELVVPVFVPTIERRER